MYVVICVLRLSSAMFYANMCDHFSEDDML